MGILSGFVKTKKYRKQSDGNYILQAEWSPPDVIEWEDGTTLVDKIKSHPQSASDITEGTFSGQVSAPAGTDYELNRMRNIVLIPDASDPGANVATSYANGSIICTYE